jgi:hypothetical protein
MRLSFAILLASATPLEIPKGIQAAHTITIDQLLASFRSRVSNPSANQP